MTTNFRFHNASTELTSLIEKCNRAEETGHFSSRDEICEAIACCETNLKKDYKIELDKNGLPYIVPHWTYIISNVGVIETETRTSNFIADIEAYGEVFTGLHVELVEEAKFNSKAEQFLSDDLWLRCGDVEFFHLRRSHLHD